MQRKIDKKNVYNSGKGKLNRELVHLHMSNHYRRLLNAKKLIDDSPPYGYKGKRPQIPNLGKPNRSLESPALTDRSLSTNSNKGSSWGAESYGGISRYHANCIPEPPRNSPKRNIDMDLIDRITYDTKNNPGAYCEKIWPKPKQGETGGKRDADGKRRMTTAVTETPQKRKLAFEKKKCGKLSVKENKFIPRILKTEAVSKLRSLRVYHPPRRKPPRGSEGGRKTNSSLNPPNCKCTKICICDPPDARLKKPSLNPKEQSLTSSRDSAYNGGVSSLADSRSPTPEDTRKKQCCCCCCCCEKKQQNHPSHPPPLPPPPPPPPPSSPRQIHRPPINPHPPRQSLLSAKTKSQNDFFKKIQEDGMYVKFIQDITTEVLEKNLYTNKALKNVMRKHIRNNLTVLDKSRMFKEVDNLRAQLGIPEDKTLQDLDESCSELIQSYPLISDSEFVLPKMQKPQKTPGEMSSSSTENEKLSLSEEDDGDVLSVIHITKAIREKRKEKTFEKNLGNSSEKSDHGTKRSALKNLKQKLMRTYSSSSSSSDGSDMSRKFSKTTEGEKKTRTVSFWKTPTEQTKTRTVEMKQKTVTQEEVESILEDKKNN